METRPVNRPSVSLQGNLNCLWMFIAAPLTGAILAVRAWRAYKTCTVQPTAETIGTSDTTEAVWALSIP